MLPPLPSQPITLTSKMDYDFSTGSAPQDLALGEIKLLQLITEARNEHGMRSNEYERYR